MRKKRPLLEPPPEPATSRADSEQIVRAIVGAAIDLGPHATLTEIASRAGVGAASLHRYFPTTSAIFAEVSRQTYRTLIQQIRDLTARTDLDLRSMIEAICQTAVAGPGLSLEHRRRLNLEIPLVWSMGVAEEVYAEVIDTVATWIRANVASPPEDLEVRIFVAFGMVRGCILMGLLFPGITPPSDRLLPTLVDSVHRILGEESPGVG